MTSPHDADAIRHMSGADRVALAVELTNQLRAVAEHAIDQQLANLVVGPGYVKHWLVIAWLNGYFHAKEEAAKDAIASSGSPPRR